MKAGIMDIGGGLRGIYAVGVLDYCMDYDIRFDLEIGISEGGANLASYAAGQRGKNYKFYTEDALRWQYMSVRNFIARGSFVKDEKLAAKIKKKDPFAAQRLRQRAQRYNDGVTLAKEYVKQGGVLGVSERVLYDRALSFITR